METGNTSVIKHRKNDQARTWVRQNIGCGLDLSHGVILSAPQQVLWLRLGQEGSPGYGMCRQFSFPWVQSAMWHSPPCPPCGSWAHQEL